MLERELSRGGMARVLLATLRGAGGFEKKLVVKQIRDELSFDQQFVRRFVEEAKTTVALSHPNIVPVYELGVEQGTYFLAMELVEGVSIAELLRERNEDGSRRVLTPEEGAYLGMEVCRALDYAHRRMKVVHRDITPRNVMLDEEGQVKLIDFGIAAPARVAGHEILGSPGHMPPEQVEGKELGPATDIFALAVLLMEAWTGVAPFRRATPDECDAAMREPHPRPSDFDPRLLPLDEAIGRAMTLDPRKRQQDATELGRVLRAFLRGLDVTDIARALGDRVRDLREAISEQPEPSRATGPRATAPSHGDMGTRTFAARQEALAWSSPPPSSSVPPDAPSTRKLAESVPPPAELEARAPKPAKADPAMSIPTPLMIDTSAVPKPSEVPTERSQRRVVVPPADRLETIATRPLETPVRHDARPAPAASRGRGALVAGATAALVLAFGAALWRAGASAGPDAPAAAPTPSATTGEAPAPKVSEPGPKVAPPPGSGASAPARPTPPAAPATTSPSSSTATVAPSTAPSSSRALVTFLGDPGTRVSVDGVARGACPVRVTLEAGQHEAFFTFAPTGESRGQPFTVKGGEKVTVRADFTAATPVIRIHR